MLRARWEGSSQFIYEQRNEEVGLRFMGKQMTKNRLQFRLENKISNNDSHISTSRIFYILNIHFTICKHIKTHKIFSFHNKQNITQHIPNIQRTLCKNFSRQYIEIFLYFPRTDFHISCKLSPVETICMKCKNLFLGKIKKNIIKFVVC